MSGSIITSKGRARFAECAAANQPLNITHFVFADIPGNIDPGTPPESLTALPGAEVYRCPVLKRGKLSDDAVVYSVMIGASVGNFTLNAMGLLDSTGALVAVSYFPRQTKTAASGTVAGNVLSKNFTIRFPNASAVTGITVDPACWQVPDVFPASTFALKNHTHAIAEVSGLQAALDNKAAANHNHTAGQITGLQLILAPYALTLTGEIKAYSGATVPAGYLECNGAEISKSAYPELFAVIGTAFGTPLDNTKFKLPDLRGEFIRGLDNGRGVDPSRKMGSAQGHAVQTSANQKGYFSVGAWGPSINSDFRLGYFIWEDGAVFKSQNISGLSGNKRMGDVNVRSNDSSFNRLTMEINPNVGRTTAHETRPRNVALMYIIKY